MRIPSEVKQQPSNWRLGKGNRAGGRFAAVVGSPSIGKTWSEPLERTASCDASCEIAAAVTGVLTGRVWRRWRVMVVWVGSRGKR